MSTGQGTNPSSILPVGSAQDRPFGNGRVDQARNLPVSDPRVSGEAVTNVLRWVPFLSWPGAKIPTPPSVEGWL